MKKIDDLLQKFLHSKRKGPTSERADLIQTICDTLFEQEDFKKILGQTSNLTIEEIREILEQAKNWQVNPQALFWKLLKEKNKEIKEQLN